MMRKNYFDDSRHGESYAYGLKCVSPEYEDDVREIIHVAPYAYKKLSVVIDGHRRRMYKIIVEAGASVEVDCVLIAKENTVVDVYVEVYHAASASISLTSFRGYTQENGKIICQFVTEVPADSVGCVATQKALFYEFGIQGGIDCIPELLVANKDVQSSHSIACERVTDEELWFASSRGIGGKEYVRVVQQNISMVV